MKKHFFAIIMILVLSLSMMVGCQKGKNNTDNASNTDQTGSSVEETTTVKEELTAQLAMDNTLDALFTMNYSIPVLENRNEKKVITASMDGLFTNVLNLDVANTAFYDELSVTVEGQTFNGQIYCDGKDLAITAPALLGNEAVGINFSTFMEDLEASGLLELLTAGLEDGTSVMGGALSAFSESMETMNTASEEIEKLLDEITQGMEPEKSEGTATVYGEEMDALIFTYHLDRDHLKKLFDKIVELSEKIYFTQAKEALDAAWDDMEFNCVANMYANPNNGCIMLMKLDATSIIEGENAAVSLALTLGEDPATSDKYTLTTTMEIGDTQVMNMELALSNTTENSLETTALTLNAEVEGEKMEILDFNATYDNGNNVYLLALGLDGAHYFAKGTMDSSDDKFIITLDTLEVGGETMAPGFTLSMENDPTCEIPVVPGYVNVLTDLGLADMLTQYASYSEYDEYDEYDDEYDDVEDFEY